MSELPTGAKPINISGTTVPFFEYEENNKTIYYFDTSESQAPHPMINAMAGLKLLDSDNKQLVMLNHTPPNGLFPKIDENFNFEISETNEGKIKVVFTFKAGTKVVTDFEDNTCSG